MSQTTTNTRSRLIAVVAAIAAMAGLMALLAAGESKAERTPHAKPGAKIFGVVMQGDYHGDIDGAALQDLNVDSVRFLIAQSLVQTNPGACTATGGGCVWTGIDQIVGGAAAAGAQLLPFMFGNSSKPPVKGAAAQSWKDFLTAAAERYGPGGAFWKEFPSVPQQPARVWQIWNEPGSPAYFQPKPNPKTYAKLLKLSGETLRAADGGAKIMLAGLFASSDRGAIRGRIPAVPYLEKLYKVPGAAESFDLVALHPYSREVGGMLDQVEQIREVMSEAGDSRTKLAITELGWSSNDPNGSLLAKGLQGQATTMKAAFKALVRARSRFRLDTVNWFSLRDIPVGGPGESCPNCPFSGIMEVSGALKPAYGIFRSFTR